MDLAADTPTDRALRRERRTLLRRLDRWLDMPMAFLGFVWLALVVVDLTRGLGPTLQAVVSAIWILFIVDFILKFLLAPAKLIYLRHNWLTALSLLAPAFRVLRFARVLRLGRTLPGLRLLRVLSSLNRGMMALGATMGRRGFGYAVTLTVVVIFAGAAGMYAFENANPDGRGLHDYSSALWWTAMMVTTVGSEYWPQTPEGRLLCLVLAIYAFAVFGYVAATLSTFFIERDAANEKAEIAGARSIDALRSEIATLRMELHAFLERKGKEAGVPSEATPRDDSQS